jgi:predicted ATPase
VGRENELSVLRQAWHAAISGRPQVVALVAEARLGKTRIVQEFYRWLNQTEDPEK